MLYSAANDNSAMNVKHFERSL